MSDKLWWNYVGHIKAIWVSLLIIRVTISEAHSKGSGTITWDQEFYPEQLLSDSLPNLVKDGPYVLGEAKNSKGAIVYKIIKASKSMNPVGISWKTGSPP